MSPRPVAIDPAVLEMAPRPEAVTWGRTFAGAIAAYLGADPDTIADVRVAVSELLAVMVASHPEGPITVTAGRDGDAVSIAVSPWEPVVASGEDIDPWNLVTALFDDATVEGGRVIVRFRAT